MAAMKRPPTRPRRWPKIVLLLVLAGVGVAVLARRQLVHAAVGKALDLAGASGVRLSVTHASPWRVVLDDVAFSLRARPYAADRVTVQRPHWWTPSLGDVRIERARLVVHADGSDTDPWSWSTYRGARVSLPPALPAERLSLDGTVTIRAATLPDQALTVKLEAALDETEAWEGTIEADGPGLHLAAGATWRPSGSEVTFAVPQLRLELQTWQDFAQRLIVLPGGAWSLDGVVTAEVAGRYARGEWQVGGIVRLREGRMSNRERKVTATGVEFDIEFEDFDRMRSKPGQLRVAELRTGDLPVRDLEAEFTFLGPNHVAVARAQLRALGGTLAAAQPFNLFLDQRDLEAVVRAEGLQMEEILALARDVPAKAFGRVDGQIPLRIDDGGVRFGTGWLALQAGTTAELQFNAAGLLTQGADPKGSAYPVLQRIEAGLLRLKVSELRLELYPPNRPPGRSATIRMAGAPMDASVKAPVTLELNVNGPVERLVNLGLDGRVNLGGKP